MKWRHSRRHDCICLRLVWMRVLTDFFINLLRLSYDINEAIARLATEINTIELLAMTNLVPSEPATQMRGSVPGIVSGMIPR